MTESEAATDLHQRGVFQIAPGLWVDRSVPDMIAVDPAHDTALGVRAALVRSDCLPRVETEQVVETGGASIDKEQNA